MSRAYSIDLRKRAVAAMVSGASARAAASQFGVSVASAVRWSQRQRRTGGVLPGKVGGLGRRDLVADALSGHFALELREREEKIEGGRMPRYSFWRTVGYA